MNQNAEKTISKNKMYQLAAVRSSLKKILAFCNITVLLPLLSLLKIGFCDIHFDIEREWNFKKSVLNFNIDLGCLN